MRRTATAAVLLGVMAGGCGSDPETVNQPPQWTDAPADVLVMRQGVPLSIPLSLSDPEGGAVTVSTIEAPAGVLAMAGEGQLELYADYAVSGAQPLSVTVSDAEGEQSRIEVALQIEPLSWQAAVLWDEGAGPEVREHTCAMVDEANAQSYVFFGSGYSPQFEQMLDDVWRLDHDSSSWTQVTPSGDVPSGRGSMRLAVPTGSTTGYLWGGYGAPGTEHDELYRVQIEGGTLAFTLLTQVNTPPARSLHAFVFDAETETFALFGGVGSQIYGDTWTMRLNGDTAEWTEHDLPVRPSRRYGFFYGFDEEAGRLLLFSGAQAPSIDSAVNPARDVWALDLRSDPPQWSLLMEGEAVPEGRRNGSFAWDPDGRRLFVWGGTPDAMTSAQGLFVLDGRPGVEAWTALGLPDAPKVRSSGLGFYDGARVVMGFGNGPAPERDLQTLGY